MGLFCCPQQAWLSVDKKRQGAYSDTTGQLLNKSNTMQTNTEQRAELGEVEVGDIVYVVWGYSMTLVNFYKVLKVGKSTIEIKELAQEETASGYMTGTATPLDYFRKDGRTGEELPSFRATILRRPTGYFEVGGKMRQEAVYRCSLDLSQVHTLHRWEGQPVSFNHCD